MRTDISNLSYSDLMTIAIMGTSSFIVYQFLLMIIVLYHSNKASSEQGVGVSSMGSYVIIIFRDFIVLTVFIAIFFIFYSYGAGGNLAKGIESLYHVGWMSNTQDLINSIKSTSSVISVSGSATQMESALFLLFYMKILKFFVLLSFLIISLATLSLTIGIPYKRINEQTEKHGIESVATIVILSMIGFSCVYAEGEIISAVLSGTLSFTNDTMGITNFNDTKIENALVYSLKFILVG